MDYLFVDAFLAFGLYLVANGIYAAWRPLDWLSSKWTSPGTFRNLHDPEEVLIRKVRRAGIILTVASSCMLAIFLLTSGGRQRKT